MQRFSRSGRSAGGQPISAANIPAGFSRLRGIDRLCHHTSLVSRKLQRRPRRQSRMPSNPVGRPNNSIFCNRSLCLKKRPLMNWKSCRSISNISFEFQCTTNIDGCKRIAMAVYAEGPPTERIWASEQSIKWVIFASCRDFPRTPVATPGVAAVEQPCIALPISTKSCYKEWVF